MFVLFCFVCSFLWVLVFLLKFVLFSGEVARVEGRYGRDGEIGEIGMHDLKSAKESQQKLNL